jgi:hypothetical protein
MNGYSFAQKEDTTVSREQLYEEVWAEPMTTVALKYKVSSSFLARICIRLNVPRPQRGYWAMYATGKRPKQPLLPEARPGDELEWARHGGYARVAQLPPPQVSQDGSATKRQRRKLPQQHLLLDEFKEHMSGAGESRYGFLKPRKYLLPDIISSKETLDHALEVANALFLSFEKHGHSVMIVPYGQDLHRHAVEEREKGGRRNEQYYQTDLWSPARPTVAFIGTVAFGLTIFEMSENVEVEYQDGKYTRVSELPLKKPRRYESYSWRSMHDLPSRRLCVQVFSPYSRVSWMRQWRESKAGEFPRKLANLVTEIEAEATTIVKRFEEGERQAEIERLRREEERRAQAREEAERRRLKAIKDSRDELSDIIKAWAKAKRINEFFDDVERRAANLEIDQKATVLERLALARTMVDTTDALLWLESWKAPEERN